MIIFCTIFSKRKTTTNFLKNIWLAYNFFLGLIFTFFKASGLQAGCLVFLLLIFLLLEYEYSLHYHGLRLIFLLYSVCKWKTKSRSTTNVKIFLLAAFVCSLWRVSAAGKWLAMDGRTHNKHWNMHVLRNLRSKACVLRAPTLLKGFL